MVNDFDLVSTLQTYGNFEAIVSNFSFQKLYILQKA